MVQAWASLDSESWDLVFTAAEEVKILDRQAVTPSDQHVQASSDGDPLWKDASEVFGTAAVRAEWLGLTVAAALKQVRPDEGAGAPRKDARRNFILGLAQAFKAVGLRPTTTRTGEFSRESDFTLVVRLLLAESGDRVPRDLHDEIREAVRAVRQS